MVGQIGVEPTVFLMSRFYRPLQSPAMRTDPYGGTGWNRTNDTLGFNQVLYQLSYASMSAPGVVPRMGLVTRTRLELVLPP